MIVIFYPIYFYGLITERENDNLLSSFHKHIFTKKANNIMFHLSFEQQPSTIVNL